MKSCRPQTQPNTMSCHHPIPSHSIPSHPIPFKTQHWDMLPSPAEKKRCFGPNLSSVTSDLASSLCLAPRVPQGWSQEVSTGDMGLCPLHQAQPEARNCPCLLHPVTFSCQAVPRHNGVPKHRPCMSYVSPSLLGMTFQQNRYENPGDIKTTRKEY